MNPELQLQTDTIVKALSQLHNDLYWINITLGLIVVVLVWLTVTTMIKR